MRSALVQFSSLILLRTEVYGVIVSFTDLLRQGENMLLDSTGDFNTCCSGSLHVKENTTALVWLRVQGPGHTHTNLCVSQHPFYTVQFHFLRQCICCKCWLNIIYRAAEEIVPCSRLSLALFVCGDVWRRACVASNERWNRNLFFKRKTCFPEVSLAVHWTTGRCQWKFLAQDFQVNCDIVNKVIYITRVFIKKKLFWL